MQGFELIPFPSDKTSDITITGTIKRIDNQLSIQYEVDGNIDQIVFPALSAHPSRKDDLWKATCFEFFIAITDQSQYWEFNMSPSSDWNVYVMDAYRQVNMREEIAYSQLPFEFNVAQDKLSVNISLDLSLIVQPEQLLQIGIAAIIQTKDRKESYWALAHPNPQADFHLRESFNLSL